MADSIQLVFGVHPSSVEIVKGAIEGLIKDLPDAEIKLGISQESYSNTITQLQKINNLINRLGFESKANEMAVSVNEFSRSFGALDETFIQIRNDINDIAISLNNAFSIPTDTLSGVSSFQDAFGTIISDVNSLKETLNGFSTMIRTNIVQPMNEFNHLGNIRADLESILEGISMIQESGISTKLTGTSFLELLPSINVELETIKNTAQELATVIKNVFDPKTFNLGGLSVYENNLKNIVDMLDLINSKEFKNDYSYYSDSSFRWDQAEQLEGIFKAVGKINTALSQLAELLTTISTTLTEINSKELSVTNNFAKGFGSFEDRTTKVKLYREQLLETYRIVQQYAEIYDKLGAQKGVSGNVLTALQSIPGNQGKFIQELSVALKDLSTSEQAIAGMSNMNSINALTSKLTTLMLTYDEVHKKMLQMQQDQSTAVSKIELPTIDRTGFEQASQAVKDFTSSVTNMNKAASNAALKALNTEAKQVNEVISKTTYKNVTEQLQQQQQQQQQSLDALVTSAEKFKTEFAEVQNQLRQTFKDSGALLDTTKITEAVTQIKNEINSLFDITKISEFAGQIKNEFNNIFDTTKISEAVTQIKTEIDSLKTSIISGITEVQNNINSAVSSYTNMDAISEKIKQIRVEAQQVISEASTASASAQQAKQALEATEALKKQAEATQQVAQAEATLNSEIKNVSESEKAVIQQTQNKTDANKQDEAAIKNKLAVTRQLYALEESLSKLRSGNVNANDKALYDKLTEEFFKITNAADRLRLGIINIDEAFAELGASAPKYISEIQTLMKGLSADIQVSGAGGTINSKEIYSLITQLKNIKSSHTEYAGLGGTYDTLVEKLNALLLAEERFREETTRGVMDVDALKTALEQVGIVGKDSLTEIKTLIAEFNSHIAGATKVKEIPVKTLRDQYVALEQLSTSSAKSLTNTNAYNNLLTITRQFGDALDTVRADGESVDEALTQAGLNAKTAFEDAKNVISDVKLALDAIAKGQESTEFKVVKQLDSMTGLVSKADSLKKNSNIANTEQYKEVLNVINQFQSALNLVRDEGGDVASAFGIVGKSVEDSMLRAKFAVQGLNTVIKETEKEISKVQTPTLTKANLEESLTKMRNLSTKAGDLTKETQEYKNLQREITLTSNALTLMNENGMSAYRAITKVGLDGYQYMNQVKEVTASYNRVLTETGVIDNQNAAAAKEAAKAEEAMEREAISYTEKQKKLLIDIQSQISSMRGVLNTADNKNSILASTAEYQQVLNYINQFKAAVEAVINDGVNISQAFEQSGVTIEDSMLRAKFAVQGLNTVIKETEKEAAAPKETAYSKILQAWSSGENLLKTNIAQSGTAEFKNLSDSLEVLKFALNETSDNTKSLDSVFKELETDSASALEQVKRYTIEFNNMLAQTDTKTTLTTAWRRKTSIESILGDNEKLRGTDNFNALEDSLKRLDQAIKLVEQDGNGIQTIAQAFDSMGLSGKNAMNEIELALVRFQNQVNNTDTTSIISAMKISTKNEELLKNNQGLSNDTRYQKLRSDVDLLNQAIEEAKKYNNDLDAAFNVLKIDGTQLFESLEISALRFKDAMRETGISGTVTETALTKRLTNMQKLMAEANEYALDKNGKEAFNPDLVNNAGYTAIANQIKIVSDALALMKRDSISAEEALQQLDTSGSELLKNIALSETQLDQAVKQTSRDFKAQSAAEKENAAAEKEWHNTQLRAYNLLANMQKVREKWTLASRGKTSKEYGEIATQADILQRSLNDLSSNASPEKIKAFNEQLKAMELSFQRNSAAIREAGENTAGFSGHISNIVRRFSAWFGITRIIMKVISSIKQLISASIELDDAFTQLQIVTQSTEATYESFGNTVAEIAKRTAVSMTDITNAATTYARLGYTLEEAAKLAEYTAKLQNVGDIESSDAQDAVTAIIKAYDEIDADHIEEVMNKLITTGRHNCPTVW